MSQCNVICLAIDRLHVGYLGAYGNTWIRTPALDRLAAESFVLDRATIDSPALAIQYHSLWLGRHALCHEHPAIGRPSLAEQFNVAGFHSVLVTDEPIVAEHALALQFSDRVVISSNARRVSADVAASTEETDAAQFFAAACEWLDSARSPFFLWLHTGTLGQIWDAPLEFRKQYTDEEDPAPRRWADVPNRLLPEKFDPDELLAMTHAYAGQVTLVDHLIGSFLEVLDEMGLSSTTLLIGFSPRGFPLGQHRRVGPCDEAIYGELAHVPWMLRFPAGKRVTERCQSLVQPADLYATILDVCGLGPGGQVAGGKIAAGEGRSLAPLVRGEAAWNFDRACIIGASRQRGIIVPAWSLRLSEYELQGAAVESATQQTRAELFAKPDDWFEVNEVSDRCPEIVQQLEATFTAFSEAGQAGVPAEPATLPMELMEGIE